MESFSQFKANNPHDQEAVLTRPIPTNQTRYGYRSYLDQSFLKVVAVFIIGGIIAGYLFAQFDSNSSSGMENIEVASTKQVAVTTTQVKISEIKVYVAGAVNSPGVVQLNSKSRVVDAIAKAGGALSSANLIQCNLAAFVTDGATIYVPENNQNAASDRTLNCGGSLTELQGEQNTSTLSPTSLSQPLKVNLNSANQTELETLPGIGPSLATAIISHRNKTGAFESVNDLRKVKGIGDKKFADLKDLVST